MSKRRILPARRPLTRQRVKIGTATLYLDIGSNENKVDEIFIAVEKTGSQDRWYLDSIARLASLAIQHDVSVEDICEQWLDTKGRPSGVVQGDSNIKMCSSPLDYIARHILINYYDRKDLCHILTL